MNHLEQCSLASINNSLMPLRSQEISVLMKQNLLAPESVKTVVKPSSINLALGGHLVTSLVLENVKMFGKICRKYFE